MTDVFVFQHDSFEDLGLLADILTRQRCDFRAVHLFHGEMPTEDWDGVRALIILGGPMNVNEEERYPFLRWEKTIIRTAIQEGIALLGICVGAQLIAAAAGAAVYQGRLKEVGWYPISITPEGQVDSVLGYLPEKPTVFQWHGEGFDLPAGARRLASSPYYENQAFRIGKNVYGLQFHLEVTAAMVERWLEEHSKDLAQVPYISPDKIKVDTQTYGPTLRYYGERFLSEFLRRASRRKIGKDERQQAKL